MRDLLVIVPTRGRPQSVRPLVDAVLGGSTAATDLVLCLDSDDPTLHAYHDAVVEIQTTMHLEPWRLRILSGTPRRFVAWANTVAAGAWPHYRAFSVLGDDHRPRTFGWDTELLASVDVQGGGIAYADDLLQHEAIPTAAVVDARIVERLGYIAPPALVHLCADIFWLEVGRGLGKLTYRGDVVIEHMHPANGKSEEDDGYRAANGPERVAGDGATWQAYAARGLARDIATLRAAGL